MVAPLLWMLVLVALSAGQDIGQRQKESDYYRLTELTSQDAPVLEIGGITTLPDGRPLVCTRRGEVFVLANDEDPDHVRFTKFAEGLQEPLGLEIRDGWIWFTQRGELSRMKDEDGDDRADVIETISDWWRISGNYHEYNFGPRLGPDGTWWITTNRPFGGEPFGRVPWRGFVLSIDPKTGRTTPLVCGLRSPAGLEASPSGDMFYTDNQGEWCGASKLSHLAPGEFHGHPWGVFSCSLPEWPFPHPGENPASLKMPDAAQTLPTFKLPAVWFPYDKMGKSPSGFVWDRTGGKFGPFSDQVFVGDQHHAAVFRVCLEQVDGHWQGACFPFRQGFRCGITRVRFDARNRLLVGMTNRGWAGRGDRPFGLQRLEWTGLLPFEVLKMEVLSDGFALTFTKPVDPRTAGAKNSYTMQSYTYLLHGTYGSPETDTKKLSVVAAEVSQDGRRVDLRVAGLRAGYVHELDLSGVTSAAGEPLLHAAAYYTLINIPGGERAQPERQIRGGWRPLFDGTTLSGWKAGTSGTWVFRDGVLVGRSSASATEPAVLVADRLVGDFSLRADVRVVSGSGGVAFRAAVSEKPGDVKGLVATLDKTFAMGGLHERGGRGRVSSPSPQDLRPHYVLGAWTSLLISVRGTAVEVLINGHRTAREPEGAASPSGLLALLVEGGHTGQVEFRDVELLER